MDIGRLKVYWNQSKAIIVGIAVSCAVIISGLIFQQLSQAAAAPVKAEPENGALSAGAAKVADATASGGNAVKFGSTTDVPAGVLWSEEFTGPAGSLPNPAKWGYEKGYVRNNELQYYTEADKDNVALDGAGHLRISVLKESMGGMSYTSGSINTDDKYSFQYGYLEARIRTPSGDGVWPAFWTMGQNAGWPAGGELDVMEQISTEKKTYSAVHAAPNNWGWLAEKAFERDPNIWHTYAVRVIPGKVEFYFDNQPWMSLSKSAATGNRIWPFDTSPQYILLNIAFGGAWPGRPDGTAKFPLNMFVDYVRVYPQNHVPNAAPPGP